MNAVNVVDTADYNAVSDTLRFRLTAEAEAEVASGMWLRVARAAMPELRTKFPMAMRPFFDDQRKKVYAALQRPAEDGWRWAPIIGATCDRRNEARARRMREFTLMHGEGVE